jgi:long-chain fatty acid transport protein
MKSKMSFRYFLKCVSGTVRTWSLLFFITFLSVATPARAQQGVLVSGAGPINRSMGGASTAAPLDSIGALYWNPATTSGLPSNEMAFGAEMLFPQARLSSSLALGSLGGGLPPLGLSGSDRSEEGVFVLPSVGLVYRPDNSVWTFGLGMFVPAGFAINYPGSSTNPLLTPAPPNGFGFGPTTAVYEVFQIAPTMACQLTDRLSIGGGPLLDVASLDFDPGLVFSPNANGSFSPATHTRYAWGAGFQLGLYYALENGWQFGTSFKSPQWFESFQFNSTDAKGRQRDVHFLLDNPMICSVGGAYTGFERWTLASDMRFIDYHNTNGFNKTGFDSTGALRGLGWDSLFVLALGAQYQLTEPLSLRLGYTFNTNPIDHDTAFFNSLSPLIIQHTLAFGASYSFTRALMMSVAYVHAFENAVQGPIISPFGALPGSTAQSNAWADSFIFGGTVRF